MVTLCRLKHYRLWRALTHSCGDIALMERSVLTSVAQPYQDLIDQLLFGMAGPSADEVQALEVRYEKML